MKTELEELPDQGYWNEKDSKVNSSTSLPPSETIRVPSIWVIEAFTPALIENLISGAEQLGWLEDASLNSDFPNKVADWRTNLGGGGWLNLGYIVPLESKPGIYTNRRAPLPSGITAVHASIFQPFPSTTILICQFLLDEDLARSFEQPLSETFKTYKKPISETTISYITVADQKQEAVEVMRAYLHSHCTGWMSKYFPGYFSSELGGQLIPSCELILFSECDNFFGQRKSVLDPDYLQMLGLHKTHEMWKCDQIPNLFLLLTERIYQTTSGRMILFGNKNRILEGSDLQAYGNRKESQIVNWLSDFDCTIGTWVLGLIAEDFVAEMGRTRDTYGSLALADDSPNMKIIRKLDKRLLEFQRNAIPYSHDLASYSKHYGVFLHNVYEFQPVQNWRGNIINLFANTRERLSVSAIQIKEAEEQIRSIATHIGNLISARSNEKLSSSNLRLQKSMFWMTIVIIFLTAIMAKKELIDLWNWITN